MEALEKVLVPFVNLLNKNIQESTPAKELCKSLSGKTIAINVKHFPLTFYFIINKGALTLTTMTTKEPDLIISGSLITLVFMNDGTGDIAIRDGSLDLSGDARVADNFQKLLKHAKPDVEEEVSSIIGDVAAHRLGKITRSFAKWRQEAHSTMEMNIREYLQEESRSVPSRYENDKFTENIDILRDDVDRLEAQLNQILEDS
tara:strand:+ start:10841 stop:11446 length:606 start_codon:yes stop_codon:yes gene_type:complete